LRGRRDAAESLLDDFLSRYFVEQVPKIARRALRFETIVAKYEPGRTAVRYLAEAARAFVFGLNQAAMALARSAIEQALVERLPRLPPDVEKPPSLEQYITAAERWKILTSEGEQLAHEVRLAANRVLHVAPGSSEDAFDALVKTRRVLEIVFSAA
jgi:hypothetical protein